jgi:hypothetical protein
MFNCRRVIILARLVIITSLFLLACSSLATSVPVTQQVAEETLSEQQVATLSSLEKVDDFPLYTMHYYGSGEQSASYRADRQQLAGAKLPPAWGCSLFAAMGDADKFYGRNFDWVASPALLLFNHPTDGYDSVSMVDMAYLGIESDVKKLTELPLDQRQTLLDAPALPFDGMNERGLTVGMAAVPSGEMKPDPNKETIDSLMVIRKMLDQAASVDEAVVILQSYNIDWGSGPSLHYLIADRSGRAVLVEFYQGKLQLLPNDKPWHFATNFLRSAINGSAARQCARYDRLDQQLSTAEGSIKADETMSLLKDVSQANTQWSIVYGFTTGEVTVTLGRQYDRVHIFHIDLTE